MPEPKQLMHHPFPALYDNASEILILGSFPSVKSREAMFFYGHPQNRFWPMLALVYGAPAPQTIEEKKELVLAHHLALWDTIASCEITGSSDSSIRNVTVNNFSAILEGASIRKVLCNGKKSHALYMQYAYPQTRLPAVAMPSTSPANAAWSMEKLVPAWGGELKT